MNKTSRLMCQHIFTLFYSGGGVQKDALVQSVEFITFFLVLFFVYWKSKVTQNLVFGPSLFHSSRPSCSTKKSTLCIGNHIQII